MRINRNIYMRSQEWEINLLRIGRNELHNIIISEESYSTEIYRKNKKNIYQKNYFKWKFKGKKAETGIIL